MNINGRIDGVILDVDGTLWDSTPIVADAWTKALREEYGMETLVTADMLKKLFGRTMSAIADALLPELEPEKRYACMGICEEYEHRALQEDPCQICYPNVIETVKKLSEKVPVFIVSNCQDGYIELFMEKTGLTSYVTDTECYGRTLKNKDENIRMVVERNRLAHPVYVGDTQGDCDASCAAGVPFVFAKYGFGQADKKAAEIEEFAELLQLVQENVQ